MDHPLNIVEPPRNAGSGLPCSTGGRGLTGQIAALAQFVTKRGYWRDGDHFVPASAPNGFGEKDERRHPECMG